jgi:hypothetical protein
VNRSTRALRAAARCDRVAYELTAAAAAHPAVRADEMRAQAARYHRTADEWRRVAAAEEARNPRRRCIACPKKALPGSHECNEHTDDLPATALAPSNPTTPGGVHR